MIELSKEEQLVLFEWSYRFCETEKLAFSHHAEAVVIDKIAGQLERSLSEPFSDDYSRLLSDARKKIMARYEESMGKDAWVMKIPLEQK